LKAAYNYQVSMKDPGAFAHGGKYIIQILHDSIENLDADLAEGLDRSDAGHFAGSAEAWRHWDEDSNLCITCHQGRSSGASVEAAVAGLDPDKVSSSLRFMNIHYLPAGVTIFGTEANGAYEYPGRDYDGNIFESLADEIDGLRETLYYYIQNYVLNSVGTPIIYNAHRYPYFFVDDNRNFKVDDGETTRHNAFTPRLLKAVYNYQYVMKDPGAYAHNGKYVVQVLQNTLRDLPGGD
jgi:hypothetical protein